MSCLFPLQAMYVFISFYDFVKFFFNEMTTTEETKKESKCSFFFNTVSKANFLQLFYHQNKIYFHFFFFFFPLFASLHRRLNSYASCFILHTSIHVRLDLETIEERIIVARKSASQKTFCVAIVLSFTSPPRKGFRKSKNETRRRD